MSDHKHEQQSPLSKEELEQTLLPPHSVDYSDPKEQEKIISDHAMQIAEDKELDITFGTFNVAWAALSLSIEDTSKNNTIPSAPNDLKRVDRSVAFLQSAIRKNSLAIVALQESAGYLPLENKETTQEAVARLEQEKKGLEFLTNPWTEKSEQILDLQYNNVVFERANFKAKLPLWETITEAKTSKDRKKICFPKTILYNKNILEEVKPTLTLDALPPEIKGHVQAIQLRKKYTLFRESGGEPFIVYNVHLRHQDDPKVTINWINSILNLEHNQDKTVYIMGDFNGRFPSTAPKFVNNGTSTVPPEFSLKNKKLHDCTDVFFKKNPNSPKPTRLDPQIVHPITAEAMLLPEVSAQKATENSLQAQYFFPVVDYADHHIACADGTIKTDRELISDVEAAIGIEKSDQKEEFVPLQKTPVFLEKNIYNQARIVINASLLTPIQIAALHALRLDYIDSDVKGHLGPAGALEIKRFALYPHVNWHYEILQTRSFLRWPNLIIEKQNSSLKLQRIAKFIRVVAALAAAISIGFFAASTLFVPAVFLAAGAGLLGIAAFFMDRLGKYRAAFPIHHGRRPFRNNIVTGSVFAASACLVWGFTPAVAFAGIPLAPVVLLFAVAAIFFAAALAVNKSRLVFPNVDEPVRPVVRSDISNSINHSTASNSTENLLKGFKNDRDDMNAQQPATRHSEQQKNGPSVLVKSTSDFHQSVRLRHNNSSHQQASSSVELNM